jgi:hypothetical protein
MGHARALLVLSQNSNFKPRKMYSFDIYRYIYRAIGERLFASCKGDRNTTLQMIAIEPIYAFSDKLSEKLQGGRKTSISYGR